MVNQLILRVVLTHLGQTLRNLFGTMLSIGVGHEGCLPNGEIVKLKFKIFRIQFTENLDHMKMRSFLLFTSLHCNPLMILLFRIERLGGRFLFQKEPRLSQGIMILLHLILSQYHQEEVPPVTQCLTLPLVFLQGMTLLLFQGQKMVGLRRGKVWAVMKSCCTCLSPDWRRPLRERSHKVQ